MVGLLYRVFPNLLAVAVEQKIHVFSVSAHVAYVVFFKFKYFLNKFVFLRVYRTFFAAGLGHEHNLLFRHVFARVFGFNAEHTQNAVGGYRKQPHERRKGVRHESKYSRQKQRKLFGVAHGDAFGDEFAEYDGEVGQNESNGNHTYRACDGEV